MKVLIIGANGQIGRILTGKLADSKHSPKAMVRKKDQIPFFEEMGVEVVLGDLEEDFSHAFENTEVVVFAAGSGGHTPKSQTQVIDREGAIKAIDEAQSHNVQRFIMVSALGVDRNPEEWPESMAHYYRAKKAADEYLRDTDFNYTILKPGRLRNKPGLGNIAIGESIQTEYDDIPREDVAEVIARILDKESTYRKSYQLLSGSEAVEEAIKSLNTPGLTEE